MTAKKALNFFKEELKGGKCRDDCPQCNAYEAAIVALEKQIPKKVYLTGTAGLAYTLNVCPNCGSEFLEYTGAYCCCCGQALDWSV